MIKTFTLVFTSLFFCFQSFGQLESGSFAPDFTGTDINGNTWTLYELLDQGKSVILDISATWCAPCWGYHETKVLDDLHHTYGPDGTDELFVFLIEGDADTNLDCLYGTDDCNNFSFGDWTEGTGYPIIDDAAISDLYEVVYFPTLYHICPNRIVTELVNAPGIDELYASVGSCESAQGDYNSSIVNYTGFKGNYCTSISLEPSILVQNLGAEKMTSATIELTLNGIVVQSMDWVGDLNTFQTEAVIFDDVVVDENTEIDVEITTINGIDDEFPNNNKVSTFANLANDFADNFITLEINPIGPGGAFETYWEIENSQGNILYSGGNQLVVGGEEIGVYPENETVRIELALPSDDCYSFNFYELVGDGYENVNYTFSDSSGDLILAGPATGAKALDVQPLELLGGTAVVDNINVLAHSGENGFFCDEYTYTPSLTVQNIGSNEITTMTIAVVSSSDGLLYQKDWSGNIAASGFGIIEMNEIVVSESSDIEYEIVTVNGNEDGHRVNNAIATTFDSPQVKTETVTLEILFDQYGADDNTWYFINSAGDTLDTGSGVSGLMSEELTLPSGIDDCYEILLKDAYGDGLATFGSGSSYFRVFDAAGSQLVSIDMTTSSFSEFSIVMESDLGQTSVSDLTTVASLSLYPNPATDLLSINMETTEGMTLDVSIIDSYGQQISKQKQIIHSAGSSNFTVAVNNLNAGVYLLELSNDSGVKTKKFTVIR